MRYRVDYWRATFRKEVRIVEVDTNPPVVVERFPFNGHDLEEVAVIAELRCSTLNLIADSKEE